MDKTKELELENYRRALQSKPPLEENKKGRKQSDIEKLKALKGGNYWCDHCLDTHIHGNRLYRKHIKYYTGI